jgi:hypothetical protein
MELFVYKGKALKESDKVEDTHLHIVKEYIPDLSSLQEIQDFYIKEAKDVYDCLKMLPQGTQHQLLIIMLQNYEHLYRGI